MPETLLVYIQDMRPKDPLRFDIGEKPPFAFCESIFASSTSRWHIRETTEKGLKPGGGIDTPSLCGHVEAGKGWDLTVRLIETHFDHSCPRCVEAYRARNPK